MLVLLAQRAQVLNRRGVALLLALQVFVLRHCEPRMTWGRGGRGGGGWQSRLLAWWVGLVDGPGGWVWVVGGYGWWVGMDGGWVWMVGG